ncbi:hypothetical protein [Persephonella sp.]
MELKFKITDRKFEATIKAKEEKNWEGVPEFKTYLAIPELLGNKELPQNLYLLTNN